MKFGVEHARILKAIGNSTNHRIFIGEIAVAERGIVSVVVEKEVRVGMSLVFNAASRLEEIANVYAGPNDPQIGQN
jgi:hypothetical protein